VSMTAVRGTSERTPLLTLSLYQTNCRTEVYPTSFLRSKNSVRLTELSYDDSGLLGCNVVSTGT
jgi:hypothetical protein